MSNENLQKQFIEDAPQAVDNLSNVQDLSDCVIRLQKIEDEIKQDEENLKLKKQKADKLSGEVIPEMMESMKLKTMKLADGSAIEVKEIYSATIPVARKDGAYNWLRENGLGDIIKNDVTVTFGRGEDNKAMAYATLAKGQGYEPVQKIGVHSQTLKAVVRERIESGRDVPTDLFKTFVGNQTKITRRN